jgi:xanthosine utilization system XapX-like protein
MLHDPTWNLSEEEAKTFAEASTNVARHYNASMNPVVADWFVLIGVLGALYGPRLMPLVMRLIGKKPKEQKPIEEAPPAQFNVNLPNIGGMPMRH